MSKSLTVNLHDRYPTHICRGKSNERRKKYSMETELSTLYGRAYAVHSFDHPMRTCAKSLKLLSISEAGAWLLVCTYSVWFVVVGMSDREGRTHAAPGRVAFAYAGCSRLGKAFAPFAPGLPLDPAGTGGLGKLPNSGGLVSDEALC